VKARFKSHLVQATQVASARPAFGAGLRAAIATVSPLLIGSAFGWPNAAWMGLAGFSVALGDKGGLLRTRLEAMLPAAFFGALSATAGAIAGRHPVSAVALFAAWALAAGVARSYGAAATGTGILSMATLVVSTEQPARTLEEALRRGGAVLAGSAFAIAISLLLGRFRLYAPARRAVARVYRLLAANAPRDEIREAIVIARGTLTQLRRGLQGESARGERLLVMLESADRIASQNVGMHDAELALTMRGIADSVEADRAATAPVNPAAGVIGEALASAIAAVRELHEARSERARLDLETRFVAPIRAALTWDSAVLRHALRVATAGGLAAALTRALHIDRGYWLTLTVVVVLQPYTSATVQRGLQRVTGTIAGAIVAALLLSVVQTPLQMMGVVFAGTALTVALLPVNYGLFSFALTPTFVMLAEVHAIDRHLVWLRVDNTLIGALIAWLAAWLLWPAAEQGRVRDDLAAALRELAELTRCIAQCDDRQIEEARRTTAVALTNADASVQRALSGAGESRDAEEAMMAVLVYARRYAAALPAPSSRASFALDELADAIAGRRAPRLEPIPDMPALAALQAAVVRVAEPGDLGR
jgi:uncharacterized membrane protein YccC